MARSIERGGAAKRGRGAADPSDNHILYLHYVYYTYCVYDSAHRTQARVWLTSNVQLTFYHGGGNRHRNAAFLFSHADKHILKICAHFFLNLDTYSRFW